MSESPFDARSFNPGSLEDEELMALYRAVDADRRERGLGAKTHPWPPAAKREVRLSNVVRLLMEGKPFAAYIATPGHPAGSAWTLEDEAREALRER